MILKTSWKIDDFPFYFWPSLAPVVRHAGHTQNQRARKSFDAHFKFILGPESGGLGPGRGCGKRFDRWKNSIYLFKTYP